MVGDRRLSVSIVAGSVDRAMGRGRCGEANRGYGETWRYAP